MGHESCRSGLFFRHNCRVAAGLLAFLLAAAPAWPADRTQPQAERPAIQTQRAAPVRAQNIHLPPPVAVPTIASPAEGASVSGDIPLLVELPSGVTAKLFSFEFAYFDTSRNAWAYPGTLDEALLDAGSPGAKRIKAALLLDRFHHATQWKVHVRMADPPGPWSDWRTFTIAPAMQRSNATLAASGQTAAGRQAPAAPPPAKTQAQRTARLQVFRTGPGPRTIKLKVWNGIPGLDGGPGAHIDGPIQIDWQRQNLNWSFQYSASGFRAGTTFHWQLSRAPFPDWIDWQPTPGFGLTGSIAAKPGQYFTVNLEPLAPRPPEWWKNHAKIGQQPASQMIIVKPQPQAGGNGPQRSAAPVMPKQNPPAGGNALTMKMVQPSLLMAPLPASLTLYLRVVLLDAAGHVVGRPSNSVEMRFGPAEKPAGIDSTTFSWPQFAYAGYRTMYGYTFDWQCHVKASQDLDLGMGLKIHKGDTNNVCEDNSSVLDDIADAFSSFIDMVKDFVNWVSKTYASLKADLVSYVASALPGCDDYCKAALKAGLDYGMTALGMPPELPDFDQLEAMGEGYLVDTLAQQAAQSGVPFSEDATKYAVQTMIDKGKEAADSGSGTGASIWIPDTHYQYRPLLVMLQLDNPANRTAMPVTLTITDTGGDHYLAQSIQIPPMAAKRSYKVAVALKPKDDPKAWMDLLPSDPSTFITDWVTKMDQAHNALKQWRAKYCKGNVTLRVEASSALYHASFDQTLAQGCQ